MKWNESRYQFCLALNIPHTQFTRKMSTPKTGGIAKAKIGFNRSSIPCYSFRWEAPRGKQPRSEELQTDWNPFSLLVYAFESIFGVDILRLIQQCYPQHQNGNFTTLFRIPISISDILVSVKFHFRWNFMSGFSVPNRSETTIHHFSTTTSFLMIQPSSSYHYKDSIIFKLYSI